MTMSSEKAANQETRNTSSDRAKYSISDPENADNAVQGPQKSNVVDWDGLNDPTNPLNWPKSIRIGHVALVSIITLIAYVLRGVLSCSLG